MSRTETNLAPRSGNLVESHKGYEPRVVFFHFVIFLLLAILVSGLAYQQLSQSAAHRDNERLQNTRRILIPGPRGNIYDRESRLLVGNRPRLAVVLYTDELREEIRRAYLTIRADYRKSEDKDLPDNKDILQIARTTTVQRYLDQVNAVLDRKEKVDGDSVKRHFDGTKLLPLVLIEDLKSEEYARLVERMPVRSPLQVYASSTRFYPYGAAAAHTLGYVGFSESNETDDSSGDDLTTIKMKGIKMKGTVGRDGLELRFDSLLQGEPGGTIFRVDPSGYKINPPLERRLPVQGKNLTLSIDVDLQVAAEDALGDRLGAAVALDVRTGEVLAIASKPNYDLNVFSPRLSSAASKDIFDRNAWTNTAIHGAYPPGSTFKILTSIAALRRGTISPDQPIIDCEGAIRIGNRPFVCDNGRGHHGEVLLSEAIAKSCDIYFYEAGRLTTADSIAEESRRFHFDQRTGIELPNETTRMNIPDTAWKRRVYDEPWVAGDTANMAIGQGFDLVSPLQMACFAASVGRNEVTTKPTLLHRDDAPTQHTESIGLTPEQRAALLAGMEGCTVYGTGAIPFKMPVFSMPGVRIAGKTGTAQLTGKKNGAWFICFAPLEKPEIAVAVVIEGDISAGESYGGGYYAAPVAAAVLKKYFDKKNGTVETQAPNTRRN